MCREMDEWVNAVSGVLANGRSREGHWERETNWNCWSWEKLRRQLSKPTQPRRLITKSSLIIALLIEIAEAHTTAIARERSRESYLNLELHEPNLAFARHFIYGHKRREGPQIDSIRMAARTGRARLNANRTVATGGALPDLPFPGGCSLWPVAWPVVTRCVYELSLDDSYWWLPLRPTAVSDVVLSWAKDLLRHCTVALSTTSSFAYYLLWSHQRREENMPALSLVSFQSRAFSLSVDVAWGHRVLALSLLSLHPLFPFSVHLSPF